MPLPPIELSAPQASFLSATTDRNLLHCGQGFGKTHIEGIISALFVKHLPGAIGMIGANTYGQLSESTLFRVFQVWKIYFGWSEWTLNNTSGFYVIDKKPPVTFKSHGYTFLSNSNKIFFKNGAVIMTVSLDNYMAIDGREVAYAILDETKDTSETAVKEVITRRLRAPGIHIKKDYDFAKDFFPFCEKDDERATTQANPLYIFTSPSKEEWLSLMFTLEKYRNEIERSIFNPQDYFYLKTVYQTIVVASAYHNQHNLPSDYISSALRELTKDRADMLVYGSPFGKSGVEYYANWNRTVHVRPLQYEQDHPLHISFDFNVNPYMTMIVKQLVIVGDRYEGRTIREYCFASPHNSIEAVCRAFDDEFGHLCGPGLYYYGDASGKNTLPIEEVRNYYKVIERALSHLLHGNSKRLLRKNPNHRASSKGTLGRRDFMNKMLNGILSVDHVVDPSCKNVIADFEFTKEDANGAKLKKKEMIQGVSAEKYGHTSDAEDAFYCYLFWDEALEKMKI
jgi:hypothetical protein